HQSARISIQLVSHHQHTTVRRCRDIERFRWQAEGGNRIALAHLFILIYLRVRWAKSGGNLSVSVEAVRNTARQTVTRRTSKCAIFARGATATAFNWTPANKMPGLVDVQVMHRGVTTNWHEQPLRRASSAR